ncbi:MAG: aldo/keto reductase [Armatimonadota bacterium]
MDRIAVAGTDLVVSRICLGTGGLGTRVSREDSFRILDAYVELGGNFIDTAHVYGNWDSPIPGMSEKTIGEWLAERGCRDQMVIATKGGHPAIDRMDVPRLSRDEVMSDLFESLERLGVECVDLYWLHRDDPSRPVGELIDTLAYARARGLINWYGVSNWSVARIREAREYAARHGIQDIVASQVGWSLADRVRETLGDPTLVFVDDEIRRYHEETGFPLMAYSSQANGFFSGRYRRGEPADPSDAVLRAYGSEDNFAKLERAVQLAQQLGCSANQVALAYLIAQRFPVFPIVFCRTLEQLRDSCAAAELHLTPEQVHYLEEGR